MHSQVCRHRTATERKTFSFVHADVCTAPLADCPFPSRILQGGKKAEMGGNNICGCLGYGELNFHCRGVSHFKSLPRGPLPHASSYLEGKDLNRPWQSYEGYQFLPDGNNAREALYEHIIDLNWLSRHSLSSSRCTSMPGREISSSRKLQQHHQYCSPGSVVEAMTDKLVWHSCEIWVLVIESRPVGQDGKIERPSVATRQGALLH